MKAAFDIANHPSLGKINPRLKWAAIQLRDHDPDDECIPFIAKSSEVLTVYNKGLVDKNGAVLTGIQISPMATRIYSGKMSLNGLQYVMNDDRITSVQGEAPLVIAPTPRV